MTTSEKWTLAAIIAIGTLLAVGKWGTVNRESVSIRERCTVALASADALDSLRVYVVQPQCVEGR